MIKLESVPVPAGNLITKEIGDEIILVSEKENLIHTINGVGAVIWRSIDGSKNLRVIVDDICTEFDVNRDSAEKDLFLFISELEKNGIITLK